MFPEHCESPERAIFSGLRVVHPDFCLHLERVLRTPEGLAERRDEAEAQQQLVKKPVITRPSEKKFPLNHPTPAPKEKLCSPWAGSRIFPSRGSPLPHSCPPARRRALTSRRRARAVPPLQSSALGRSPGCSQTRNVRPRRGWPRFSGSSPPRACARRPQLSREESGRPRPSAVCPRGRRRRRRRPSDSSGAAEEFATEGGGGLREEEAEEAEEAEGRKMAAVELEWIPETLYNTAISAVVDNYIRSRRDIRSLPENIQFDVYYKVRAVGDGPWACSSRRSPWGRTPFHVREPPRLTPHPS